MSTKLLILAVTLNAVIGQLVLKRGLALIGGPIGTTGIMRFIVEALKSPWIYASIIIQGFGYLLWMVVISRVKLGVATASTSAGFYLLAALAAWALYGETLNTLQWLGLGFVTIGVICVSMGPV